MGIAKTTNLPFDVIKKHTHVVLHDESASPDKHSHIHVLVSNVNNNEVVKVISQRKTVHAIKMGFNKSVKVVLNEDHKNYIPKTPKNFDKPLWLARQEKNIQLENDVKEIESEIKQKKLKLSKINKAIALLAKKLLNVRNEISEWADDFLNSYFSKAEIKANSVATLNDNLEPIAEKELNEIDKTIKNIEAKNISAPDKAKISPKRKRRRRKNKNT